MAAEVRIVVSQAGGGSTVADAKKDVEELGRTAEKSGGGFSALKEIGIGALRELGAAATNAAIGGLKALAGAISDGISDARESAKLNAQTAAVLASTGNAAGTSAQHIQDYASALSAAAGKSLFGDDQIQQSENMLLTFTNIKGTVLDAATAVSVDMAQALGGAPRDNAIQLGKALNDPVKGITALTRVGVTFSQEQKDMIQALVDTGDTAGAQQVILGELNKEFGGSAEAAAKADGGWAQFNDRMGEAKEAIGTAVMPLLNTLAGILNDKVAPVIEVVAAKVGDFFAAFQTGAEGGDLLGGVVNALYSLGGVSPIFDALGDAIVGLGATFTDAQTPIEGVLNVLSSVSPSFAFIRTAVEMALPQITALASTLTNDLMSGFTTVSTYVQTNIVPIFNDLTTALAPLLGAAIQVLAGLWSDVLKPALVTAWNIFTTLIVPILADVARWMAENLPPAIQAVADFLTGTLFPALHQAFDFINTNVVPILASVVQWLQVNVPIALQAAADFWNNVLHPALTTVWAFISNNVIPIVTTLVTGAFTTLQTATQSIADFWNNILKPALSAVWAFINTYVIPIFTALANVAIAIVKKEVELLAALWTNVLQPALNKVWSFIATNLTPVFTWLHDNVLVPLYETFKDIAFFILGTLQPYLAGLSTVINGATATAFDKLSGVADGLKSALHNIGDAIQSVIKWLGDLASAIDGISVPDFLKGHSPPPLANWFSDIAGAAQTVNTALQQMGPNLSLSASGATATAAMSQQAVSARTYHQNKTISATFNYHNVSAQPTNDSAIIRSLAMV